MNRKKTWAEKTFTLLNGLLMTFMAVITLYPMMYVIFASFSQPSKFIAHKGVLLKPLGFTLAAYEKAFQHPLIINSYMVTLFVLVVGLAFNIVLTALGAYGLTRKDLYFKRIISFLIMFTMFFSGGLIPFYMAVKDLHLLNSIWSLILPSALNTFNLIVLRTAFFAVPDSIEESATIDGAGHFTILFRILLPLTVPTVAVITLYYGVGHWNAWFNASIFLNNSSLFPLQLVLRQVLLNNDVASMTMGVDTGDQMAISQTIRYSLIVIATLPILVIYPFLQKYFVSGVMIGAVKG